MHIGIIGGGLMGVALAYYLTKLGERVTLLEQSSDLGGLNGAIRFPDGLTVARYQHVILPTDTHVRDLCAGLGLSDELVFSEAPTGFVQGGQLYAMTTLRDFLMFTPLSMTARLRLGRLILLARRTQDWRGLDRVRVKQWLIEVGGQELFERIWRPLLDAKFDGVYSDIPATYIWAWLNRMSAIRRGPQMRGYTGYLLRGHSSLIQALADALTAAGGRIETQVRVREIDISGGALQQVRTLSGTMHFDALVAAVATPAFARLIPGADEGYLARLQRSKYQGLICPVMVLDQPLSAYWTLNVTDGASPFSTIIETEHAEYPELHVVYLPKYTAPDNDWMGVSDDEIREAWLNHLKHLFPHFNESHVLHFAVSRSRYVEPVHSVNALETVASVETPYRGLYLANTSQVYPELPTSEAAIAHARQVAQLVHQQRNSPVGVAS
jgi:protoporphyrinogen oxidase